MAPSRCPSGSTRSGDSVAHTGRKLHSITAPDYARISSTSVIAHVACGENIEPLVVCSHCRLPLTGSELRPSTAPAPEAAEA